MFWQVWRNRFLLVGIVLISFLIAVFLLQRSASAENPTLYWGKRGDKVYQVQQRLKQWGYYRGSVNGVFGYTTWKAVRSFQQRNGLRVDGIVGPATWAALGLTRPSLGGSISRGGISTRDQATLLAHLIEGEAADEPYVGKVAVGAVILNRVENSAFPKTISGVIFQPGAFESVTNGRFNYPFSIESLRAAVQALSGWDPTGGALFFWNPAKRVNPWIWSRRIIAQIGRHIFAH